jgi:hypothetical protein
MFDWQEAEKEKQGRRRCEEKATVVATTVAATITVTVVESKEKDRGKCVQRQWRCPDGWWDGRKQQRRQYHLGHQWRKHPRHTNSEQAPTAASRKRKEIKSSAEAETQVPAATSGLNYWANHPQIRPRNTYWRSLCPYYAQRRRVTKGNWTCQSNRSTNHEPSWKAVKRISRKRANSARTKLGRKLDEVSSTQAQLGQKVRSRRVDEQLYAEAEWKLRRRRGEAQESSACR